MNALPNGSDANALNASLALFVAKGSWSPNPSKVAVPSEKASAFAFFVSSVFFVASYLFFYIHIYIKVIIIIIEIYIIIEK